MSRLWRRMYSPQEALNDIESVLMDELSELLARVEEKAEVPENLTSCLEDLLTLGRSKQIVKMIGGAIDFRVQGLETLNQNILRDVTLAYAPAFRFSSCHAFMVFLIYFYTQF